MPMANAKNMNIDRYGRSKRVPAAPAIHVTIVDEYFPLF
jgi:hypothetical protein